MKQNQNRLKLSNGGLRASSAGPQIFMKKINYNIVRDILLAITTVLLILSHTLCRDDFNHSMQLEKFGLPKDTTIVTAPVVLTNTQYNDLLNSLHMHWKNEINKLLPVGSSICNNSGAIVINPTAAAILCARYTKTIDQLTDEQKQDYRDILDTILSQLGVQE